LNPTVSCAGDVNGDGLDDLILGAYTADPNGKLDAGKSYVVFGKANGSVVNLTSPALEIDMPTRSSAVSPLITKPRCIPLMLTPR
jgi:hypothetical protein